MSVKTPKEKPAKKDKPKKALLVTRYQATAKADTDPGKKLLAGETQSALVLRACRKPATFAEVIAAVSPSLKGKKESTVTNNIRWYLSALRGKGFLKATSEREEVKQ